MKYVLVTFLNDQSVGKGGGGAKAGHWKFWGYALRTFEYIFELYTNLMNFFKRSGG